MLIAQITDTHIKAAGKLAYRRVDTAASLARVIDHVNGFTPAVDAVILSGDLTDAGRPEEFELLLHHLGRLKAPWYVIPGNHDKADTFRKAFAGTRYQPDDLPFYQYVVDDHPIRLIGLDSTVAGKPHGFMSPEKLDWLDARLTEAPDRPTLLFVHHPPFVAGIRHMDVQRLLNGDELMAVAGRHKQVRHLACGHLHRACEQVINGIGVSTGPCAAHAVTLDLDPEGAPGFSLEPAMMRLFYIDEAGQVLTHLSMIGDFEGPYPFFDAEGCLID